MRTLDCPTPDDTMAAGAKLAAVVRPGDVVLLDGDLGAGKTTFTQGLARAVGVKGPVTSPTFTLVNVYPTPAGFDLVHADVYRLERLSEVVDLALPEMLDTADAVLVVEWGSRAAAALPPERLLVSFTELPDGGRRLAFEAHGSSWDGRCR